MACRLSLAQLHRSRALRSGMVEEFVHCCSRVGLCLHSPKTKILTPSRLLTFGGHIVDISCADDSHKWLGCTLPNRKSKAKSTDVDFRLQNAFKACLSQTSTAGAAGAAVRPSWSRQRSDLQGHQSARGSRMCMAPMQAAAANDGGVARGIAR